MKFAAKPTIEPLESRIAPARVISVGAPDTQGNDTNYTDTDPLQNSYFVNTEDSVADKISANVGAGVVGLDDTFYIRLSKGDVLKMFNTGSSFEEYLTVKSGNIVAFFVDGNGNNEVEANELTGIAMGKGASFTLRDDVQGDIVANLNEHGTANLADDDLDMTGLVSGQQFISGIEITGGRVGGSIVAGGNINFVKVEGTVTSILTGDAANGKVIDFFAPVRFETEMGEQVLDAPGGTGIVNFVTVAGKAGGSIKNIFVDGIGTAGNADPFNGKMIAGGGGTGAAGGSITLVQVNSDRDGFLIQGGLGGAGTNGKGGVGGSVSRIYVSGTPDATTESVIIKGGVGGSSIFGAGGAGGKLKDIFVGYRLFGSSPFPTDDLLEDVVEIEGGAGGSGKIGGAGGSVTNADVRVKVAETADDEIFIKGGNGGDSTQSGGKGGAGGSLVNIKARNQDLAESALYSDIVLLAGAGGGAAGLASAGGAGGNVTKANLLGWELNVRSGSGGDGKSGGKAGSMSNLAVEVGEGIQAYSATFLGGNGGIGDSGSGGAGGNVSDLRIVDADFANFLATGGNGGNGLEGKGGAGGFVKGVDLVDGDFSNGATQTTIDPMTFAGGLGGDGRKGGGAGGALTSIAVVAKNANVELLSGAGGDVLSGGLGKGGNSGSLNTISVVTSLVVGAEPVYALIQAGEGGSGGGKGSAGGAGGDVRSSTLTADGAAQIVAGKGGSGQATTQLITGGASGKGGSIIISQVTAKGGDGKLIAGDAGTDGAKAGAGGSVIGNSPDARSGVFARDAIVIQAGDGAHGGAGGSVRYIGYGSSTITFSPSPFGNIDILAGNGSGEGKVAGAGGSIIDVSGSLSSPDDLQPGVGFVTTFRAGDGGSTSAKSGAGGSIRDINILNGGYIGAELVVRAGDAGNASGASSAAKGGDVNGLVVSGVGDGTLFRAVVAGNGGSASITGKGGAGGSITGVYVDNLDIGSRNDVPFGIDQMGGIFAGAGGTGAKKGLNGKVANVVAKGIGAIVAGHDLVPEAAESVSNIVLSGSNTLLRSENVFVEPGPFRLGYTAVANATETVAGGTVQEEQTIILRELRDSSVVLSFTFDGETSDVLAGNATAQQIQDELNEMDSVADVGGVTVTATADGIAIKFNATANQTELFAVNGRSETGIFPETATADDVELALNNLRSIQYLGANLQTPSVGSVDVTGEEGSFKVNFLQPGDIVELDGIEVFSSNLTELTQGSVDEFLAEEIFPGAANFDVDELQSGQVAVPVITVLDGDDAAGERQGFNMSGFDTLPSGQIQFTFTATGDLQAVDGTATTRETQTLLMAGINPTVVAEKDTKATFTLSFNPNPLNPNTRVTSIALPYDATLAQVQAAIAGMGLNAGPNAVTVSQNGSNFVFLFTQNGDRPAISANVTSTSAPIPATATDAEMEVALNKMAPVKFTNPTTRTGGTVDVEVDVLDPQAFFINFAQFGDQNPVGVSVLTKEVQEIDHSVLDINDTGEFTLSFGRGYTATELQPGAASVREIQGILLGPISGDGNTSLVFSFNGRSTTTALFGNSTTATIQSAIQSQLNLPGLLVGKNGTTLTFTFPGFGNNPLFFTMAATSKSAPLPGTADNLAVQTALNGLSTIKGPTGTETVTVTSQGDLDFEVVFETIGQRDPIVAALTSKESQQVDVRTLLTEATGAFRLSYGGVYTEELSPNATTQEVAAALNALTAISAPSAGGVVVTSPEPGVYNVEFGTKGDQLPITVRLEVDEIQNVDYTPGKPLTLGVNLEFTAAETLPGNPGLQEVQVLALGDLILSSADTEYTISYFNALTNQIETTRALAGTATAAEIQQAINDLPGFIPGDVTVDLDDTTISFTFDALGDQPYLFTAVATDTEVFDPNPTETELETALNLMATVQAAGFGGVGGKVDVTPGVSSSFTLRFSSGGGFPMVTATQEQPLNVITIRKGGDVAGEIQAFSPLAKGQPLDAAYAVANLIGFYADHTEIDANVFHFLHNNVLTTSLQQDFVPGDQPIDGLVFAKKMTAVSVTPEAYRVGDVFYDWNNII